ncbi:MAG: hypothetical protein ACLRMJ_05660 [Alistipes finegoldii]
MDRIADGGRAVAVLPDARRSEPFREEVTFQQGHHEADPLTAPHLQIRGRRAQRRTQARVFTYGNWAGWQDDDMECDRPRTAGGDRAGGATPC